MEWTVATLNCVRTVVNNYHFMGEVFIIRKLLLLLLENPSNLHLPCQHFSPSRNCAVIMMTGCLQVFEGMKIMFYRDFSLQLEKPHTISDHITFNFRVKNMVDKKNFNRVLSKNSYKQYHQTVLKLLCEV